MSRRLALLMILSVLNMSLDGAIDSLQAHPHEQLPATQADVPDRAEHLANAPQQDSNASDHCEQCCHGHMPALTENALPMFAGHARIRPFNDPPSAFASFSPTPPTPPPTA